MNLKILGFFVSALFIFGAFWGFAYGKKMMTTQEKISSVSTVFDQTDKIAVIIDTDLYWTEPSWFKITIEVEQGQVSDVETFNALVFGPFVFIQ